MDGEGRPYTGYCRNRFGNKKVRYNTIEKADAAAMRSFERFGFDFHSYKCRNCRGYHVGSFNKWMSRDIIEQFGGMVAAGIRGKTVPMIHARKIKPQYKDIE